MHTKNRRPLDQWDNVLPMESPGVAAALMSTVSSHFPFRLPLLSFLARYERFD